MKQELNAAGMQLAKNREVLIKKMEKRLAYPPSEEVISEGSLMDYAVKLFDKHSVVQPSLKAYQYIIDSMLFLYQTNPSFIGSINRELPVGFDLNSIQLKLFKLSSFFKSLEDDDSSIASIEYRRLSDEEIVFTESDFKIIKNQMWGPFDLEEVGASAI